MKIKFPSEETIKQAAELYANALDLKGVNREICIHDITAGANWMRAQVEKKNRRE